MSYKVYEEHENNDEVQNAINDVNDFLEDNSLEYDPSQNDVVEVLEPGLTFSSWDDFKIWISKFALKEGFDYKIRTSEKDQDEITCRVTSSHNPLVSSDPTKHRNAGFFALGNLSKNK
ncbi:hypothetical protein RhiirA5_426609 [Rhizophagus irregularis]|uniref:Uncharacterized protein n=1 Tax=Rhizophagus irregularis TaxID=588596 RepID=A0A2N0P3U2_9GLOM|nr:hypothetical protein RhiirA5_426609 [Rhizophagus irregularis]PKC56326.1 hypothetical protein RhiirA1_474163 [Rhizophagus irregularis]GBC21251.2 hypothetical protein RIR_jg24328.t1 [Rhizophagus irregularis DAOM 181602=DAOM 197198]